MGRVRELDFNKYLFDVNKRHFVYFKVMRPDA